MLDDDGNINDDVVLLKHNSNKVFCVIAASDQQTTFHSTLTDFAALLSHIFFQQKKQIRSHITAPSNNMKLSSTTFILLSCLHAGSGFVHHAPTQSRTSSKSLPTTAFGVTTTKGPRSISRTTTRLLVSSSTTKEDDTSKDMESIHRDADCIFTIIDVDGSGTISREELTDHLSVAGYTKKVINKIYDKMDYNKDNQISKEEFRGAMFLFTALQSAPGLGNYNAEFVKEMYEDADHVFQSADADGNGEIDQSEMKSHLSRMFAKSSDKATDNIFRMLDTNGDGRISREEFRDAFCRYSALRQAIGEGPNFK
jgi:Ca2+-binding EF-hand superfamily protein